MVFSSPIFLFVFLPCLIMVYFLTPKIAKNVVLLAASLLFYAWGEGVYLILMLLSICLNYVVGIWIDKSTFKKFPLAVGVIANLLILVSFKYLNFICHAINNAIAPLGFSAIELSPIHLPLGISFFTFQALSYLIDIYRREIESQKNVLDLGLYIALFPQLIAGPIVRYKTIISEIADRRVTAPMFAEGVERFIYGLSKKMLIANPLGYVVDTAYSLPLAELPTHVAWFVIICYALQIYFDFSGYSDMAIGLGRMFGFKFLENFNYPYFSQSLQEFWRRWHISLSSWFRDYLYIPLGGNRLSPFRTYINLCIVFLLCGLWHGASWNFIIWGAFHGFILVLERLGLAPWLSNLWRPLRHFYLVIVVLISWVFFRAESLSDAMTYLSAMFSFNFSALPFEFVDSLTINVYIALFFGLILSFPVFQTMKQRFDLVSDEATSKALWKTILKPLLLLALLALCVMNLAVSTHNPFIYFRF